jgi:hypothetical protein
LLHQIHITSVDCHLAAARAVGSPRGEFGEDGPFPVGEPAELEQSLAEQLAGAEGDQVAGDPGRQAQQDVGRIEERARDLAQ